DGGLQAALDRGRSDLAPLVRRETNRLRLPRLRDRARGRGRRRLAVVHAACSRPFDFELELAASSNRFAVSTTFADFSRPDRTCDTHVRPTPAAAATASCVMPNSLSRFLSRAKVR